MSGSNIFSAGRTAVITGAASGIGLAAARHCASAGMNVIMADRNEEALNAAAITGAGSIVRRALNVSDFDAVRRLSDEAFSTYGDIALLMNNAGRSSGGASAFSDLDRWRETFDVNFWGAVHGVQAFTQRMIDQKRPACIVNTGSKQGITTPPGDLPYNATKAALKVMTEGLQHALRNIAHCEVSAHLLVPGFTYTGLTRSRLAEKPPGACTAEQVVEHMIGALARGDFYIICPDNETTLEMDSKRILWAAQDVALNRPALSRWHPDFKDAFAAYMAKRAE